MKGYEGMVAGEGKEPITWFAKKLATPWWNVRRLVLPWRKMGREKLSVGGCV